MLEVRPSKSRPDQGLIKVRMTTLNQHDEAVQISVGTLIVPRRASFFGHRSRKAAVTAGMGKYGA